MAKTGRPPITQEKLDEHFTKIENYLKIGCSLYEACTLADVPYTTIVDHKKKNATLRKNIEAATHYAIALARESVVKSFKNRPDLALKYLEKKLRDEFGSKITIDSKQEKSAESIHELTDSDNEILKRYVKRIESEDNNVTKH